MKSEVYRHGFLAGIGFVLVLLTSYSVWQRHQLRAEVKELFALVQSGDANCLLVPSPSRYAGRM